MSYTYEYPRPCVTVDAIIFSEFADEWKLILIRRLNEPFKGMWALPGGFVEMDETLEEAVIREVQEETGLSKIDFRQLHTFSKVGRDPRHRTITTVFIGFASKDALNPVAGDDANEIGWFSIDRLPDLAFDHEEAIKMAIESQLPKLS
jgi:8-oxo-dGTP diphosphatase